MSEVCVASRKLKICGRFICIKKSCLRIRNENSTNYSNSNQTVLLVYTQRDKMAQTGAFSFLFLREQPICNIISEQRLIVASNFTFQILN